MPAYTAYQRTQLPCPTCLQSCEDVARTRIKHLAFRGQSCVIMAGAPPASWGTQSRAREQSLHGITHSVAEKDSFCVPKEMPPAAAFIAGMSSTVLVDATFGPRRHCTMRPVAERLDGNLSMFRLEISKE